MVVVSGSRGDTLASKRTIFEGLTWFNRYTFVEINDGDSRGHLPGIRHVHFLCPQLHFTVVTFSPNAVVLFYFLSDLDGWIVCVPCNAVTC